jgi:serine/threonine-protein kinase
VTTIGEYEVTGELGRGAMGVVFRVRHRTLHVERALKLLGARPSPQRIERFLRETAILARLGGSGILPVHEGGVHEGRPYMVMTLMRGGSLRERLETAGRLPWTEASRLVIELASALERCHANGVIHRDLKPDNILFDDEGLSQLADFGIAKDLEAVSLTKTGTLVGTPAYAAPEQLAGEKVDARADVYSLGVILYELVTGSVPFRGDTLLDQLGTIHAGRYTPASRLARVPSRLDAVIARALAPDPGRRLASAAEVAAALVDLEEEPAPGRRLIRLTVALAVIGMGAQLVLRSSSGDAVPRTAASSAAVSSAVPEKITPQAPVARVAPAAVTSAAGEAALARARRTAARAESAQTYLEGLDGFGQDLTTAASAGVTDPELGDALANAVFIVQAKLESKRQAELYRIAYAHDRDGRIALLLANALLESKASPDELLAVVVPHLDASTPTRDVDVGLLCIAAVAHLRRGEPATALGLARRAYQLNEMSAYSLEALAKALVATGDAAGALPIAEQLVALDDPIRLSTKQRRHGIRGRALCLAGRWAEAIPELENGERGDDDPALPLARARARFHTGDVAAARDALRVARERGARAEELEAVEREIEGR